VAHDGPGDGNLLLRLSSDDQQIAVGAAQGLVGMKNLPTAADILLALPKREDSMVREGLYLALGKTGDQGKLEDLRAQTLLEKDNSAREDSQTAAVKLGGDVERKAFFARVQSADVDHAIRCRDQLMYLRDESLAKALIPWLEKNDGVMRLGSDRPPQKMVRMKDLAVWIAFSLGIKFKMTPEYLTNFEPGVIQECGRALVALPNP
jgi:HEAT repeat protein